MRHDVVWLEPHQIDSNDISISLPLGKLHHRYFLCSFYLLVIRIAGIILRRDLAEFPVNKPSPLFRFIFYDLQVFRGKNDDHDIGEKLGSLAERFSVFFDEFISGALAPGFDLDLYLGIEIIAVRVNLYFREIAAEADQLMIVRSTKRATHPREIDRFQEIRLALRVIPQKEIHVAVKA